MTVMKFAGAIGWNWVTLKGKDASITGELPDFDNICRFRIYVNNIEISTLKIDRITIGYINNTALFVTPEWEKEIVNNDGTFKGSNNYVAENSTYIEIDFDSLAEDYVVTITHSGCVSSVSAKLPICLLLVGAAMALLFKKTKKE